jgi:hypothetical protein
MSKEHDPWVDEVLEKARLDYKLEEFLKVYDFHGEPSSDIKTRTTILSAKEHLSDIFDEWLAYMEDVAEQVYKQSFHADVDNASEIDILDWFEAYFHSYMNGVNT